VGDEEVMRKEVQYVESLIEINVLHK